MIFFKEYYIYWHEIWLNWTFSIQPINNADEGGKRSIFQPVLLRQLVSIWEYREGREENTQAQHNEVRLHCHTNNQSVPCGLKLRTRKVNYGFFFCSRQYHFPNHFPQTVSGWWVSANFQLAIGRICSWTVWGSTYARF